MGNYRCEVKNISRGADGKGKSSVAASAYRAGENLYDLRHGVKQPYKNRTKDIYYKKMVLPEGAPRWGTQRGIFWNKVEVAERYKNARTAKELELMLPYELTRKQYIAPVEQIVKDTIISKHNIAADVAIHLYGKARQTYNKKEMQEVKGWRRQNIPFLEEDAAKEDDKQHVKIIRDRYKKIVAYKLYQPHAHILMPLRAFDENSKTGFAKKKNRAIEGQVEYWRKSWETILNDNFEELGLDIRVSSAKGESKAKEDKAGFAYRTYKQLMTDNTEPVKKVDISKMMNPKPLGKKRILKPLFSGQSVQVSMQYANDKHLSLLQEEIKTTPLPDIGEDEVSKLFQAWAFIRDKIGGFSNELRR